MIVFSIGNTNFEVNVAKSNISLEAHGSGMLELNIDIDGDDEVFMRLTEPEDAEWSWALYPPAFFLHGLRIPEGQGGALAIGMLDMHPEAEESGIYMMEYGDVSAVNIIELSADRLAVSGMVDLCGKRLPFHIDMPRR
ncbi:hypothetical protein [Janthinobacterium lividum]|uniref:hypothetical protein n=1 Tax=Janthinobacterium lividum TaxID=29581 RepID=UPI0008932CA2|nr:hypothetical protein [Janthinobacterium lividum]MCC7713589.1 hypothetical protein [Janthinobacterium lividum]OEZ52341.1 hypothetical protein JANLI_49310 [Janthinobacterium lividum]WQE26652.1 hypothetical protein U0004_16770 [Janthinobacterium lividum]STQ97543.1 Uncharacterised protein [Janthinobacterium lividum]